MSALAELQALLPCGDVGRIINSFIFTAHPDALAWQRAFRASLYDDARALPFGCVSHPCAREVFATDGDTGTFTLSAGLSRRRSLFCERGAPRRAAWGSRNKCRLCCEPINIHFDDLRADAFITQPTAWVEGKPCGWDYTIKPHKEDMCCCCIEKHGFDEMMCDSDSDAWSIYSASDIMQ